MDIKTIKKMESTAIKSSKDTFLRLGLALVFLFIVVFYAYGTHGAIPNSTFLIIATLFGAYMAMNIGANDVANNVGPAVGSKALTMTGAIILAVIFEASGAIIAGGDVVKTIKKGIIDPSLISDPQIFVWAMTAALLAAALWLNLATAFKAPVSTTHSIVGGVMGAGIAVAGFGIVAWGTMGKIAASWVISPILGGVIAALFLFIIKKSIIFKEDKITAAQKMVPILVSIMAWAFGTYLMLKGVKKLIKVDFLTASLVGLVIAVGVYFFVKHRINKKIHTLKNKREDINSLFTIPLIFAAALLSFAHGANDVANAIGPLAGIYDATVNQAISAKTPIPLWIMLVGAIGIAVGLALYGPRLIRMVGSEITELDQIRAYSIAMAAAITVIIASQLGLPVSSTHIAVGGVFGVGFLREWLEGKDDSYIQKREAKLQKNQNLLKAHKEELASLQKKEDKKKKDYQKIAELYEKIDIEEENIKKIKKQIKGSEKIKYVKREALKKIVAAWIITVPSAALLAAGIFFMIKGIMTP